jgi:hypothetical protein
MWITVRMVGHYCNAHDSPFLNQPIDMVGVVSAQFPFRSGCTHRIPWFTMQTPKKLRPQKNRRRVLGNRFPMISRFHSKDTKTIQKPRRFGRFFGLHQRPGLVRWVLRTAGPRALHRQSGELWQQSRSPKSQKSVPKMVGNWSEIC